MKKTLFMPLALLITFGASETIADDDAVRRVPAGAVAYHFVLSLSFAPPPPELVGYLAFIEGVEGSLFNGPASKDTAFFTTRVTTSLPPFIPLPVEPDPNLSVALIPPGGAQFTIYYDETPGGRDWNDPNTFSNGVPVAVFEESALLNTNAGATIPGVTYNVFSSKLIESTRFRFKGQKIDFKKLVPYGVTISNFGNGLRPDFLGAAAGATAIAIGGPGDDEDDDD